MNQFQEIYDEAHAAGLDAVSKLQVIPMIVGTAKGFSNEIDYSKPTEYVADGVCGFAWINIKPGNSTFANWLKKQKLARKDEYYGGVTIWISDFNQSMQKKEAYARAFANILCKHGYTAYSMSRMD